MIECSVMSDCTTHWFLFIPRCEFLSEPLPLLPTAISSAKVKIKFLESPIFCFMIVLKKNQSLFHCMFGAPQINSRSNYSCISSLSAMVCAVSHEIFMQFRKKLAGGGGRGRQLLKWNHSIIRSISLLLLDLSAGQAFHPRNFAQELFTFSCQAC